MALIKYNVIVQESAELDIDGIIEHISHGLQERRLALNLYRRLTESMFSLKTMPGRCKIIDEEPYKAMKLRRLIVDNYSIFYIVNDEMLTVHIIRVLYNHRDWQNII